MRWQFWIDRGGTFTDCLARNPESGELRQLKVLSSDEAPLIAIRQLLGLTAESPIPPCDIRMGTTIATNALLERHGANTALAITRGFGDLLEIGTQARPEIFALEIDKRAPLYREVVEVDARADASGCILASPDAADVRAALTDTLRRGSDSLAVVVLHAYAQPSLEESIATLAREVGFRHVTCSHEVASEIGMLSRGDTAVVDAYLTPLIRDYVSTLRRELHGSSLLIMQSSGGLTDARRFRGRDAVLSGPAAGVVASAHVARDAGFDRSIGFDMGGTSTDVSCYEGKFERSYENEIAGVRLRAPMMSIHTVAAGGGSLCRYRGYRFTVGPESAGASPGPLCYADPAATELTVTDINWKLGRVVGDRFPFPLDGSRVDVALEGLAAEARRDGSDRGPLEVAVGLFEIANSNMAEAVRQVSIARGRDVREYALVVFGGAGGQHACPLARMLGMRTIVVDQYAGVLSAYGMGLADLTWHGVRDGGRHPLAGDALDALEPEWAELESAGTKALTDDGAVKEEIRHQRRIDLRYVGSDTALTLELACGESTASAAQELASRFAERHREEFGYFRPERAIEVAAIRVESHAPGHGEALDVGDSEESATTAPTPRSTHRLYCDGTFRDVPVYHREDLRRGQTIAAPALILDATGTVVLDPGFALEVGRRGRLLITQTDLAEAATEASTDLDPVRLEIFNNLFMSIAQQMGEVLRRTAVSTNIRERLDFSCACFDRNGGLVANAPHIPVHLGAMAESVRCVIERHPSPQPGSMFVTNDPARGGSHLPDITVVCPVHDDDGTIRFFVASRGHHADIGGTTPGSMPHDASTLREEGVVLDALPLVRNGRFDEDALRRALADAAHPARNPDDNVADIQAQVAANHSGASLLRDLLRDYGADTVEAYMQHVQDNAALQVVRAIAELEPGTHSFEDALDDGSVIAVSVTVDRDHLTIDFTGTAAESESNLNAPRAVTMAAVLYVLRSLVGAPIPLNSGCLRPVKLLIPEQSILAPSPERAVSGGNVETSQRVVDVLLGALGRAAASQGTMNNLTFGNQRYGYYETIAGGAGASPFAAGASAVHTHMTNTRITDPEVLEARYPVRLVQFRVRRGSGGAGQRRGGDGVVREFELLEETQVTLLTERRVRAPFGLSGGEPGEPGRNFRNDSPVPGRATFLANPGDRVRIETPGGGGYGRVEDARGAADDRPEDGEL